MCLAIHAAGVSSATRWMEVLARPGAIQHYLGHRNIQHTARYTELASDRFKNFWH